jgi:hypothetical protein
LFLCISITVLGDVMDVNTHLELGKKFLQDGQLSEALMHYSAACGKGSPLWTLMAGLSGRGSLLPQRTPESMW